MNSIHQLTLGAVTAIQISEFLSVMQKDKDVGGLSFFLGQVRADSIGDKVVKAIDYSAYERMVFTEAEKIIDEIETEFRDVKNVIIIHSTGVVNAGEISLAVMISAGHRQQALMACSKTVDLIKERYPVWKREIFDDNTHEWKENA